MRVIEQTDTSATVELTRDELRAITQALNEVLNGPDAIEEPEFGTRMGVELAEAERLLASMQAASPD